MYVRITRKHNTTWLTNTGRWHEILTKSSILLCEICQYCWIRQFNWHKKTMRHECHSRNRHKPVAPWTGMIIHFNPLRNWKGTTVQTFGNMKKYRTIPHPSCLCLWTSSVIFFKKSMGLPSMSMSSTLSPLLKKKHMIKIYQTVGAIQTHNCLVRAKRALTMLKVHGGGFS